MDKTKGIRFAMGVFKGNTMEDLRCLEVKRRVRNFWNKEFMAVQFKRVRAMAGAVGRILEKLAVGQPSSGLSGFAGQGQAYGSQSQTERDRAREHGGLSEHGHGQGQHAGSGNAGVRSSTGDPCGELGGPGRFSETSG